MSYKKELLKTMEYIIEAVNISPLSITNGDNSLKYDCLNGMNYIPGSSIAGSFRNYYERMKGLNEIYANEGKIQDNPLFGGQESGMSLITFYDAFIEGDKSKNDSRPGLMINRDTGTVDVTEIDGKKPIKKSGKKFDRYFLSEGHKFLFRFELNNYKWSDDFENMEKEFEELLSVFAAGDITFGSNKMIGYGRFSVKKINKSVTDFTSREDVINYLLRNTRYDDITRKITDNAYRTTNVRFEIDGEISTPLLIRDEVIRSKDEPDGINIMDGTGNYIIPGSSLKGVIRARAEKIFNTIEGIDKSIIKNIFGKEPDRKSGISGQISKFKCYDCPVKNPKKGIYNKIKIDYFTGGVIQGALTDDEVVMGNIHIVCTYDNLESKNNGYEKEVGLLLMVLRDICKGDLNIGSGYAIGRGYISARTLKIKIGQDSEFTYDYLKPDNKVEEIFNKYINRLFN